MKWCQKKTNRDNVVPLVYLHSFSVGVQFESQTFKIGWF